MHRVALRTATRPAARSLRTQTCKRFASTASSPADRPRSWKGSALRWGLAGAALYYYNTSTVFADEIAPRTIAAPPTFADDELPTVDSVIEEKRKLAQSNAEKRKPPPPAAAAVSEVPATQSSPDAKVNQASQAVAVEEGAGALEEEAGQQGAFNPETGEINWDCPCLGGMAHGPCGEEFKTAFSCFVFSEEEPKGMDCIDKFQGMQECFRQYPEIYGAELADEEEASQEGDAEAPSTDYQKLREDAPTTTSATKSATDATDAQVEAESLPSAKAANGEVPAQWEDATGANAEVEEPKKEAQEPKEEAQEPKEEAQEPKKE